MAQVTWTFRGRLLLDPQLPEVKAVANVSTENYGLTVPLAGVRIEVSAKQFDADPTGWETWGEAFTDEDGRFEFTHVKNGTRRLFRVRALFKGEKLKIYAPNDSLLKWLVDVAPVLVPGGIFNALAVDAKIDAVEQLIEQTSRIAYDVKWQTIRDNGVKYDDGVIDFGNFVFAAGAGYDLDDFVARRHAEIWYVAKKAMDYVDDLGEVDFRSDRPIAFMHPHDNGALPAGLQSSYANPHNDVVYLVQNERVDDFNVGTIIHEMMHLWAYQHTTQEERLATYLLTHFDTHTGRLAHYVACHEAMAEALANQIEKRIFGTAGTLGGLGITAQHRPLSRPYLRSQGMRTIVDLDFFEDGWLSTFGLLLCPDVCDLDMNVPGPYAVDLSPGVIAPTGFASPVKITLAELMRVIARGGDGRDDGWASDAMRIGILLARCNSELSQFTADHHSAYMAILDPSETKQPRELLTFPPTPIKIDPANWDLSQPRAVV